MRNQRQRRFAIVRGIPDTFDQCIKSLENPQPIDVERARTQHGTYCEALSRLGFQVIALPADNRLPDCPFVEDTAVVVGEHAIMTRPGAELRRGEVESVHAILAAHKRVRQMTPPGTLDGGDVLLAEDHLFVGLSERTNPEGFRQIDVMLRKMDLRIVRVPMARSLHLKTACNYLGRGLLVVNHFDFDAQVLSDFEILQTDPAEAYKLSFLSVDDCVLVPDDCLRTQMEFEKRGWKTIPIPLSEIRKAQAGLTCMSILFEA